MHYAHVYAHVYAHANANVISMTVVKLTLTLITSCLPFLFMSCHVMPCHVLYTVLDMPARFQCIRRLHVGNSMKELLEPILPMQPRSTTFFSRLSPSLGIILSFWKLLMSGFAELKI